MCFVDATAILIEPAEASELFKKYKMHQIPSYLKRMKGGDPTCMFLVCMGCNREVTDSVFVKVPGFAPCTTSQYSDARAVWPCSYSRLHIESVAHLNTNYFIQLILSEVATYSVASSHQSGLPGPSELCSCICIIADDKNKLLCKTADSAPIFGHGILQAVSQISRSQMGYLCTGYTAYLYSEPCLSCAMALVHGRIKRVICYTRKESLDGAFSTLKFNYNQFLNHRYDVYFVE